MTDTRKWSALSEMWSGLGVFLIVVILIVVSFLNGQRDFDMKKARINACGHATNVVECIKAVR